MTKEGNVIAMHWCEGFLDALHLREPAWEPYVRSKDSLDLMYPIFAHLLDGNGNSLVGVTQEQLDALLDAAAERIPDVVPKIFGYWRGKSSKVMKS